VASFSALVTVVEIAFSPGRLEGTDVDNPLAIRRYSGFFDIAEPVFTLLPLAVLASAIAMVRRFRRAGGEQRAQLKWFAAAAIPLGVLFVVAVSVPQGSGGALFQDAATAGWAALPIAAGIAILRYRLYDIDVVINRAVVLAVLAAFIAVVYVAIVVGVGALLGSAGDPNIVLSILATTVVAVAFQPARERAQRFANRLVYGERATPYEVLAEFSEQASAAVAAEDVLPRVARIVGEGTGAERSEVWLKSGAELRLAASWPEPNAAGPRRIALDDGRLPSLPAADRAAPVRHHDELLGALTVSKSRGETLTPAEDKLLHDLAAQAGLVLRNVGLTAELLARLDELQASRQRLVSAQDEERRRLERDLHDGAQQHLVGLKVKLNLAARQAEDAELKEALVSLQTDADDAIEALRELARGIYPPLLADQGLVTALEAHTRKSPVPVHVRADGVDRYPRDVEAAVYFCCLEALQNVAKYADASEAVVRLREESGQLHFTVEDDGRGFDPATTTRGTGLQNMVDRLEALGGWIHVTSTCGRGTTVTGELPLGNRAAVS
jgi:signal transduction histidine kinase